MATTETRLTRAAIALSVVLVLVLGALATYSVLGAGDHNGGSGTQDADADEDPAGTDDSGGDSSTDTVPEGPQRAYPGPQVDVGDRDRPLRVGCLPATDPGDGYAIVITNLGTSTVDYLVSVSVVDDGGDRLDATVEVPALQAAEQREMGVPADDLGGEPIGCTITAVQTDRRVLLANS